MVNHSLVKLGGSKYVARKPVRRSKSKSRTPKRKVSSKRKTTKRKSTKRKGTKSKGKRNSRGKGSKRRKLKGGSGVGYSLSLSNKIGGKSVIDRLENCKAPMGSNYSNL